MKQYPIGRINQEGQSDDHYWAHTPFSTSDLLKWENSNLSHRDDPQKLADLVASVLATHHPNWADVQALLNILLMADERQVIINKDNEGTHNLHQENLNRTRNPARAIPLTEPNWDPNSGDLAFLEHYKSAHWKGLRKGCLNKRA